MGRIINLEINEIPPSLLIKYIAKNKKSNLSKLKNSNLLDIYITKAVDIKKEKLYPSQTWASFNTGKPFSEHRCYWYSDGIDSKDLTWCKLADSDKNVGVLGSIHSSKIPNKLFSNPNYKFYLPDCFGDEETTKPIMLKGFQSLVNTLVGESARVTGILDLVKVVLKYLPSIIISPKRFGVSIFSTVMIFRILYFSIKNKNKEFIRMAHFPLVASLFNDLFIKYKPDYSVLFSNHVAGNMHRYWYAHDISAFRQKNKYSKKWFNKNHDAINFSIDLLDSYIGFIFKKREFKDSTILISSSMGQEPNPNFDAKFMSRYDGKIDDINIFIEKLCEYQKEFHKISVEYEPKRNMAPQYGFRVNRLENIDLILIVNSIGDFINSIGLKNKVHLEGDSIVITIDPYTDINLQKNFDINQVNKRYSQYGFSFFPIDDHHSGSHSPEGVFAVINQSEKLTENLNKSIDSDGIIDYLNCQKIIIDSIE